jgi:hypothetical protein
MVGEISEFLDCRFELFRPINNIVSGGIDFGIKEFANLLSSKPNWK